MNLRVARAKSLLKNNKTQKKNRKATWPCGFDFFSQLALCKT